MPSFPDSVWAPSAKAAGNTIQAAHVNDAQDEIVAIEGGYRNGTAPLNSSGSTLASLDVNGNSTFASSITFGALPYVMPSSGGSTGQVLTIISTSGSTMGLEWRASGGGVPDAARVELEAVLEVTAGSSNGISWTRQVFQTNSSLHSTATNPDRITPQSTGVYLVIAGFAARTAAGFGATIKDSSGAHVARLESTSRMNTISALKRFDVLGGYVRMQFESNGASNGLATTNTFLSLVKL